LNKVQQYFQKYPLPGGIIALGTFMVLVGILSGFSLAPKFIIHPQATDFYRAVTYPLGVTRETAGMSIFGLIGLISMGKVAQDLVGWRALAIFCAISTLVVGFLALASFSVLHVRSATGGFGIISTAIITLIGIRYPDLKVSLSGLYSFSIKWLALIYSIFLVLSASSIALGLIWALAPAAIAFIMLRFPKAVSAPSKKSNWRNSGYSKEYYEMVNQKSVRREDDERLRKLFESDPTDNHDAK
jgi:hypothetical protein